MTVSVRQSVVAEGSAGVTATLASAPVAGNLLVAWAFSRGDVSNDPTPSVTSGWTLEIVRNTAITNSSRRRGLAGAYKVAGESESSSVTINYNAQNFNDCKVVFAELQNGTGPFLFLASESNDNGETQNGDSIATGTTESVPAVALALVLGVGSRQGTAQGTQTIGWDPGTEAVSSMGGSNGRTMGLGFHNASGPGGQSSVADFSTLNSNTGLSAGIMAFAVEALPPEFDPANLQAVVDGSNVDLSWDPSF